MLFGGFLPQTANLVEGAPGTGKTTIGMQFIYNGITRFDEPGLIITFEEFPQQYYHDAAAFGWDFGKLEKDGKSDAEEKPLIEQLLKIKLAAELHGLAEKVAKEGTDGNLTVGKIQVKNRRIEIRVQVSALSDEVLAKLKKLGFKELARAKSVKLLIGTIEVMQLEALAKLAEVRRIDPSS